MGISSSQVQFSTVKADRDGESDRDVANSSPEMAPARSHGNNGGRTFGPVMSPSPQPYDENELNGTNSPAAAAAQEPPTKKKHKKRRKSIDSAAGEDEQLAREHAKKSKKKSRKKPAEDEDVDAAQDEELPKRKSKKKSKKNATREVDGDHDVNGHSTSGAQTDEPPKASEPQQSSTDLQSPSLVTQKKTKRKNNHEHRGSDAEAQTSVPHRAQLPPSAQVPTVNGILKYGSEADDNADEEARNPSGQPSPGRRLSNESQYSDISASQIKAEALSNDEEELYAQFSGGATVDPSPENGEGTEAMSWLHKREEEDTNDETALDPHPGTADESLPDLVPSQIKPERDSDTDSDSDAPAKSGSESESPSAARAGRLDKSRSRSGSKASTTRGEGQSLADETQLENSAPPDVKPSPDELVESNSRTSSQPNGAPSTGSDGSISPRIELEDSSSGSDASIPPEVESQAMSNLLEPSELRLNNDSHVDSDVAGVTNGAAAQIEPTQRQPKVTSGGNVEDVTTNSSPKKREKSARKKVNESQSNGPTSDQDFQVMAEWLQGSAKRKRNLRPATLNEDPAPQSSTAYHAVNGDEADPKTQESTGRSKQSTKARVNGLQVAEPDQEAENGDQIIEASPEARPANPPPSSVKRRRPKSSFLEAETAAETSEQASAPVAPAENARARNNSVEPGESASQPQPKGRRKRKLQGKTSLSLSQLEGDEPAEGESRLSTFSQKSKRKDAMRGGSTEPDPSEVGASREPSLPPQQTRKPRKKRRTENAASEDEMESLLAAGPSKNRKRTGKRDFSDDEDARAAKRKRLSKNSGGAATGPWTAEEFQIIEKVYADFRDANGMTEQELNEMIHERPDKANSLHQEFWNRADVAVPQRTRKQIVERVRRLYNNFTARGTWTDEQKEEVHELFEKHGKKFSHIAGLINRDQKDVRDYWRNKYLVHETQVKSRWTKEEEERLKEVVEEAIAKIRIQRENSGELRTRPRAAGDDEEALLDWHQISVGMDLTRSRAQCKWKWIDMREKGLVGEGSTRAPTQAPSSTGGLGRRITETSEELLQAREGFDKMTDDDKRQLIEAIHDCGVTDDANIPWSRLVNNQFRSKWTRPILRLAWYRLRKSVPDYDLQSVEDNARYLMNHNLNFEDFPLIREGHIDDLGEEKLIHPRPGNRLWKRPSQDLRAVAERQRRASKVQRNPNVANEGVERWLRENSADLGDDGDGEEDDETGDEEKAREVPIRIPKHLKGEAAKKALQKAREKLNAKGSRKGKEPARRGVRSASVAIDSDSE